MIIMALNASSLTKAAWGGVGLSITFALINGVSTYLLTDDAGAPITLHDWVDAKVGGS